MKKVLLTTVTLFTIATLMVFANKYYDYGATCKKCGKTVVVKLDDGGGRYTAQMSRASKCSCGHTVRVYYHWNGSQPTIDRVE